MQEKINTNIISVLEASPEEPGRQLSRLGFAHIDQ